MQHYNVGEVLARAKSVLGLHSDKALAAHLQIPRATVASWKRRNSIPVSHLAGMAEGISLDWLLTGRGNQYGYDADGQSDDPDDERDVDVGVVWIAMVETLRQFAELNERGDPDAQKIITALSKENLDSFHLFFCASLSIVQSSKKKWERSGLMESENIFDILSVEFRVEDDPAEWKPWFNRKKTG